MSLQESTAFPFSFVDNISTETVEEPVTVVPEPPKVEVPEIPPVIPLAEEPKVPETIVTVPEVIPEAPKSPEQPEEAPNNFSILVKHYKEKYNIPVEDTDIPEELDGEEFATLVYDSIQKKALADLGPTYELKEAQELEALRQKGFTEEQIEMSNLRVYGVPDEALSQAVKLRYWANVELTTDDQKETVARIRLALEGNKKELIDTYVETHLQDATALDTYAAESQEVIGEFEKQELEAEKQNALALRRENDAKSLAERKSFEKIIDNGFLGIKLTPAESESFKKYMFEKNVVIEVDTPQGKKRIPITPEEKYLRELYANQEKRILYSYFGFKGVENVVNKAHQVGANQLLSKLRSQDAGAQTIVPAIPPKREVVEDVLLPRRTANTLTVDFYK